MRSKRPGSLEGYWFRETPARLASLMEEKLVTRISVLSTLLGGGKTTERLLVRISIETHETSPDFDQTAADKAKNRIKQALGEIGCDVFIETDQPYLSRLSLATYQSGSDVSPTVRIRLPSSAAY
jgi:hypothetical protein